MDTPTTDDLATDDLSSLQQQVMFSERWRGYDPGEVDAYVERVLEVVARAKAQLATTQQVVDNDATAAAALTEADKPDAPHDRAAPDASRKANDTPAAPVAVDLTQTSEGLARTLALAQSAADEAIAEARQRAAQIVNDAEAQSANAKSEAEELLASARSEASKIRSEADEYAKSTVANVETLAKEREVAAASAERQKYATEIADLSAQRALLAEDLELLDQHLVEQRHQIEQSLATLTDLVMSPETFRTSKAPPTKAAETSFEAAPPTETVDAIADKSIAELDEQSIVDMNAEGNDDAVAEGNEPRFLTVADLAEQTVPSDAVDDVAREANDSPVSHFIDDDDRPSATARTHDEEPFLTQLREATSGDDAQTDSDDAMSAFFNQDEEQRRSPWFLGGR